MRRHTRPPGLLGSRLRSRSHRSGQLPSVLPLGLAGIAAASLFVPWWSRIGSASHSAYSLLGLARVDGLVDGHLAWALTMALGAVPLIVALAGGSSLMGMAGASRALCATVGAVVFAAGVISVAGPPLGAQAAAWIGLSSGALAAATALPLGLHPGGQPRPCPQRGEHR